MLHASTSLIFVSSIYRIALIFSFIWNIFQKQVKILKSEIVHWNHEFMSKNILFLHCNFACNGIYQLKYTIFLLNKDNALHILTNTSFRKFKFYRCILSRVGYIIYNNWKTLWKHFFIAYLYLKELYYNWFWFCLILNVFKFQNLFLSLYNISIIPYNSINYIWYSLSCIGNFFLQIH